MLQIERDVVVMDIGEQNLDPSLCRRHDPGGDIGIMIQTAQHDPVAW